MAEFEVGRMEPLKRPSWILRRIAIFGFLILCTAVIIYLVGWGTSGNTIHDAALAWAFGGCIATVFTYSGWATIEDISLAKLLK